MLGTGLMKPVSISEQLSMERREVVSPISFLPSEIVFSGASYFPKTVGWADQDFASNFLLVITIRTDTSVAVHSAHSARRPGTEPCRVEQTRKVYVSSLANP